jgi:hypothetical protein
MTNKPTGRHPDFHPFSETVRKAGSYRAFAVEAGNGRRSLAGRFLRRASLRGLDGTFRADAD